MDRNTWVTGLLWCGGGIVYSSFVEYWAHRILHQWRAIGGGHREHHARGVGQGVVWELWDYVRPSWPMMLPPLLISWTAGIGWIVGCLGYALFSAYAHQLQHDNPAACFWMPMPTHYVHHKYNMWHYNFGLALDIWDRVFRTYKPVPWREDLSPELAARRSLVNIRWW
jgi:sterol desaturase/sphingolipid hydroxylase (fatty acid hydroxylase superfamily)